MRALLLFACVSLLAGCAGSPGVGEVGGDENLLTQEQIASTGATTLYRVVRQARPRWIPRGPNDRLIVVDDNFQILDTLRGSENLEMKDQTNFFFRAGNTAGVLRLERRRASEVGARLRGSNAAFSGAGTTTWVLIVYYR